MRTIPPFIVSAIAVAALFIAAFVTISNQTALEAGASVGEVETTQEAETTAQQAERQTVTAQPTTEAASTYDTEIMSRDWSDADSNMLLKISMAEAEGEGVEGKALVMLVVLNRVWSEDFPDTVEEVIFQSGQFSVVKDGGRYYTTEPDEECYEALELVESGWDESKGALYFESYAGGSWHSSHLKFLYEVGNHRFYK